LVDELIVLPAAHLLEVSAHLHQRQALEPWSQKITPAPASIAQPDEVVGQQHAKRALEIAASGGHHLLFYGPPGTGKTLLASHLPSLLPPLDNHQALQVAAIHSAAGKDNIHQHGQRPFRTPHHSASAAALVGGGSNPKPGEISLAHEGVLFLDELPEFQRQVLEMLREPLESGEITISRVANQICYPARFQLIAAMNPCPCGYLGSHRCICSDEQINRYRSRLSGPLMDRIDLQVQVSAIDNQQLLSQHKQPTSETTEVVQQRVSEARDIQLNRQGKINSALSSQQLKNLCPLNSAQREFMDQAINHYALSTRGFYRVLKVARTIADLAGLEKPTQAQYQEALSFRSIISHE
jgi:magnesium chelatase family protein